MTLPIRDDLDFTGGARIRNLPTPANADEPVRLSDLNSAVEGLAWKDSCRVATQGNISLASPGASVDGVTMVANDRVLVRAQTAQAENGIYIWNGAAVPLTRALDASTSDELEQATTTVEEGTSAGATFRQTTVNFVLNTGNVVFSSFGTGAPSATETTAGIAEVATQAETDAGTDDARIVTPAKLANWPGRVRRFQQTFGDGSATSYVLTHNLNTRDVDVAVAETGGSFRTVLCGVEATTANSVTLRFSSAPASNSLRATVMA